MSEKPEITLSLRGILTSAMFLLTQKEVVFSIYIDLFDLCLLSNVISVCLFL